MGQSLSMNTMSGAGAGRKKLPTSTEQHNSGSSIAADLFQKPTMIYFQRNL